MVKNIAVLLVYLVIFAVLFGLSVYDYLVDKAILDIGMPAQLVNLLLLLFTSLAVLKTTYNLYTY